MARINKGSQQQANYYFDRGNPEPLDSSMLYNSYSDLKEEIAKEQSSDESEEVDYEYLRVSFSFYYISYI